MPTRLKDVAGVAVEAVVGLAVGALVVATGGLAAAALGVTAVQLGMTAGVLTAGAGIAAVAATAASDRKNGTESSMGDYISNAFSASARVGASCIAITLGMYGAEVMTLTVSGGMGLIPVGGTVVTLPQLAGAFQLVPGTVTSQNLLFQMEEVRMFCASGKEMGAPTGNWLYDSVRELTEMASMQFAVYGLMNPYTYQRPKITPLPNETGLTVPGGAGVAVVPNGTASALKQPYLPGQYTEYPAAVQGWAQQALPGWGSGIETSYGKSTLNSLKNTENFTESAIEHIFEGQVNARGKAVGYHYEGIEGTSGNAILGAFFTRCTGRSFYHCHFVLTVFQNGTDVFKAWTWCVTKCFDTGVFQTFCTIAVSKFHQRCAGFITLLLYLMHIKKMLYQNEGGMTNLLPPVQKTFCIVFQKFSVIFRHVFRYINRFRRTRPTHMRRYTIVMVEDFNTVFSSTNIYFFTDKLIRNRILAISDFYEIIRLYVGS